VENRLQHGYDMRVSRSHLFRRERKLLKREKGPVRRAGERLAGEAVTASEGNGDVSLYRVRARPGSFASRLAVMSAVALVAKRRGNGTRPTANQDGGGMDIYRSQDLVRTIVSRQSILI